MMPQHPRSRRAIKFDRREIVSSLPRLWVMAAFVAYVGLYGALIGWFKGVDVYHVYFARAGKFVVFNNVFRAIFIFYLFLMVHAVGSLVLRFFARGAESRMGMLDQLALGFFAGAGVWHVLLLALGFLNLYTVPVAVIVTVPAVILSFPNFIRIVLWLPQVVFDRFVAAGPVIALRIESIVIVALSLLLAATFGALLIVKGLYPAGGHDYFTHYFYYYLAVIEHGGLWPNEVWYHYFYSKGAGLYFLGILLTDPLAPQLVTFCFVSASALVLLQMLRRIAPGTLWPFVGVALYLGFYIYTPGPDENRAHGGWGDFEKLHEINAAFVIAILWMLAGALQYRGLLRLYWTSAAALAIIAAIIVNVTIAAYLGVILVVLAVGFSVVRNWARGFVCISLAALAGVALIAMLTINYFTTGLINDQGILFFWRLADVEKLHHWGALPQVIVTHWLVTDLVAHSAPLSFSAVKFVVRSLRLDLLFPLFGMGLAASVAAMAICRARVPSPIQALVVGIAVLVFVGMALVVGRSQPISFYRYSSFVLPIVIAAGVILWMIPQMSISMRFARWGCDGLVPLAVYAGCIAAAYSVYPSGAFSAVSTNAWRFAKGTYSIDTAYTAQGGWPGRLPWGAIYPGARAAYEVVGPSTPIWSMHVHSYCMLPNCNIRTFVAFTMTPDWDRIMFGAPEEAREVLRSAGINYFLFSRELARDLRLVESLPLSALFSPENISRYLGVRWTDGNTVLLTWRGPDTLALDESWVADYRRAVEASHVQSYPFGAMKGVYEMLRNKPHPWRSFDLPWKARRPY